MNSMEQDIKNLQEIINLCNEELDNEDENVTAVLDLVDLKSLRNLIKAYKELEEEKENQKIKTELEKKNKQIEQYQNMLATNDMLHVLECEKKDKMIDLMGEKIFEEGIVWENKEDVKQYFERKVEGK